MAATIREYRSQDLEGCRAVWRSLTQRHRDLYGDPTLGGEDPGLEFDEHLGRKDLHRIWVAVEGERVLGFCGLLVGGEESELEPIVVDPQHRGRGIGASLATEAIHESRELGMKYVNVRPAARNLEAIRFFHREGFGLFGRLELSMALEAATPFGSRRSTVVHGLDFEF